MSDWPGRNEAWECATCHRLVLGEGSWGISPTALCTCSEHDRKPLKPRSVEFNAAFYDQRSQLDVKNSRDAILRAIAEFPITDLKNMDAHNMQALARSALIAEHDAAENAQPSTERKEGNDA